jgi:hypothetical protein
MIELFIMVLAMLYRLSSNSVASLKPFDNIKVSVYYNDFLLVTHLENIYLWHLLYVGFMLL